MKLHSAYAASAALLALGLASAPVRAAVCNPACGTEILAASGLVVNDIFRDANNNDATHLPVYGTLIDNWPGCGGRIDYAGAGISNPPYDCPGQYGGAAASPTVADANKFLSAVDRQWWQPCRLANPTVSDIGGGTMCTNDWSCIADGTGGNYNPWQGLVFDLGGPSNKVAIFAENDHVPQPCESLEYTVFLSDNPYSREQILHPATDGVDPTKWNRAVLSKIYTKGFVEIRPPDPAGHGTACGDVAEYSVEEDSFVQVFSLPCGITFRYAAIVAGNDGLDFGSCAYDSSEGEIDAVAGLTESGSAVCPDADGDHYVDCNCPGAPPVCDCNDKDPNIHPGAPESCDSGVDLNCDGNLGNPCPTGLTCQNSLCLQACGGGENPFCPAGTQCQAGLCVPTDCGCAPGQVCINNQCVDACQGVACPGTQICQDGVCVDPCANIQCPQGTLCEGGVCVSPCSCYAGNLGCSDVNLVCDNGSTNTCVDPMCKGVQCPVGQTCDPMSGTCVSFCNPNVQCPVGQKCAAPNGCVPNCQDVTCQDKWTCDPATGQCKDTSCDGVTCFAPQVCVEGNCVTPDGGAGGGTGGGGHGGSTDTGTKTSAGGAPSAGDKGSCGCRVAGDGGSFAGGALALLGLAAAVARRRR